jgi:hypothetical protein
MLRPGTSKCQVTKVWIKCADCLLDKEVASINRHFTPTGRRGRVLLSQRTVLKSDV